MRIKITPINERDGYKCHFCGETRSVKYTVNIYDPVVDNKMTEVCCCNKCALMFNDKAAEKC